MRYKNAFINMWAILSLPLVSTLDLGRGLGPRRTDAGYGAGTVQHRDLFPRGDPGQHGGEVVTHLSDGGSFHVSHYVTLGPAAPRKEKHQQF